MNTATLHRPTLLTPTNNPAPVEHAAATGIADDHDPETFLWITFHRPDGGARIWYAWTTGGTTLGDRADLTALANNLDASDWLHIGDRHCQHTTRGRIAIQAHPLRPILADIQADIRSPQEQRDTLHRLADVVSTETGQPPQFAMPRWIGFGPTLLATGR